MLLAAGTALGADSYKSVKEIPISGAGGWDYLSIDAKARRLYVTHADEIVIVDLDKNTVAGEIAGTIGVHGFAIAPELGRGFSSTPSLMKARKMSVGARKLSTARFTFWYTARTRQS